MSRPSFQLDRLEFEVDEAGDTFMKATGRVDGARPRHPESVAIDNGICAVEAQRRRAGGSTQPSDSYNGTLINGSCPKILVVPSGKLFSQTEIKPSP